MLYFKEEQYYIDLYDLHTIEECLDWYFSIKKGLEEKHHELKDMTPEAFDKDIHKAASYTTNVIKIQRFRRKAETISEWMDRDRKAQDKFDNAIPPEDIFCKECISRAKVSSKDLLDSSDESSQVMFMFECVKCKKRQTFCTKTELNGCMNLRNVLTAMVPLNTNISVQKSISNNLFVSSVPIQERRSARF